MSTAVPQTKESKFYAGLYLRTRTGARFWGWGQPPLNENQSQAPNLSPREAPKQAEAERPWASLAEWLRQAHSSTFAQNSSVPPELSSAGKAREAERALPAQQRVPAASSGEKRRLRFVWDRKFIGFVIR
ncbi:MAG: hypothetical protein LAO20_00725 [Acidobacteriia bacterium]|nr:hypothetical protein [Terriglobia bacterium]